MIELAIELHCYWITNNLSSLFLNNWAKFMRLWFFSMLAFIYLVTILFLLNRIIYFGIGYNMFNEEKMRRIVGI